MLTNTPTNYGIISKSVHWLVALTVCCLFGLGLWMVDLTYYDSWYRTAPMWHKSVGVLLMLVMVFRVLWLVITGKPEALVSHSRLEVLMARAAHWLLVLLIFAIGVSGYLISTADGRELEVFDWFSLPSLGAWIENQEDVAGEVHEILAFSLIGLALLHGLAAIKHHYIDKDSTLKRMF